MTGVGDEENFVRWWGNDLVATATEILRMAVVEERLVAFDAERLQRLDILSERPGAAETVVEVVDLREGEHYSPKFTVKST